MAIFGFLAGAAALAGAADGPRAGRWHVPPAYQQGGWQTRCRAGTDGFAVNCEANMLSGPYWYRIIVADAQVSFEVRHGECSTDAVAFSRETMASLPAAQRHRQAVSAFDIAAARLRRRCPTLPATERDLTIVPDLAVVGEEVLSRR
ncbi:MAG TPA: hypothetical protein VF552_03240 [Allosphingosinicella sp.]|jgi:hypothetical protein